MEPALLARVSSTARAWVRGASHGYCGITTDGRGDCEGGTSGSFPRVIGFGSNRTASWLLAAEACVPLCWGCQQCEYISIGIHWPFLDCSWHSSCSEPFTESRAPPKGAPRVSGFLYGAVSAPTPSVADVPLPPLPWPSARPPRLGAAAALQVSGHVNDCDAAVRNLQRHLAACREAFERCDLFVTTWDTLAPLTVHWTGRNHDRRHDSSAACVQRLEAELKPAARVRVARQPPPPADDALAPDGAPFRADVGLSWGAPRYFGFQQSLRGMAAAGALRRRSLPVLKQGGDYAVAMRLRPDGRGKGGYLDLNDDDFAPLWDCVRAKADGPHTSAPWVAACNPFAYSGLKPHPNDLDLGSDNCFFGPPMAVDRLIEASVGNATAVYTSGRASFEGRPERSLAVAARMAGVKLVGQKVGEAPAAQWAHIRRARHFSCSHDDLQLLVRGDLD